MISVEDFGRLRFSDYFPEERIGGDDNWQFLGRSWVSQGFGFTDFLALPDAPKVTRCISVDFEGCGPQTGVRLMRDLGLPLAHGMSLEKVEAALGAPVSRQVFVPGRASHEFKLGELPWTIDATIDKKHGLIFVVIHPPLP
jgi:hypothetical protein